MVKSAYDFLLKNKNYKNAISKVKNEKKHNKLADKKF